MNSVQDPTPCPPRGAYLRPRHQHPASSSIFGHSIMSSLQNVKPRRPRRPSKSTMGSWDPTVDIHEDTFELHNSLAQPLPPAAATQPRSMAAAAAAHHESTEFSARPPSRRSSLLIQPAQRLPVDPRKSDLSLKRRKISTLQEVDETCAINISPVATANSVPSEQPTALQITRAPRRSTTFKSLDSDGESEPTQMLRSFERVSRAKGQEAPKDPRRRTIFIPSQDITQDTINPGNSLRNSKASLQRKARRSDIFLDIAEAVAEEEQQQELEETSIRRPPRKSLAVAPQRGPLQSSKYRFQANTFCHDRPGAGGGKENVPPGGFAKLVDKQEPSFDATVDLDLTNVLKQGTLNTKVNEARSSTLEKKSITFAKPPTSYANSLLGHSGRDLADNVRKSAVHALTSSNLQRRPRRSSIGGASFLKPDTSSNGSKAHRSQRASTARPSINPLRQYPAISQSVSTPSLFEDNWLGHQETAVTQFINGLLENAGNPENTDTVSDSQSLRAEVLALYQDQSVVLLYKRIQASLNFGGLSLPKERLLQVSRFREDLAQKQRFLDLWLKTYRLEYLQAGAEAVIGREITTPYRLSGDSFQPASARPSRSKSKSIEAFLKVCLINNEDLSGSPSNHMAAGNTKDDFDTGFSSAAWQWCRTVVRSLMLVLMLDKAKESGRFKSTLFQTSSPFKTSSAVLQALSMLLLPSIGDTSRVLAHLNYQVSHAQLPLNEYDYRVRNLAVDLRDGIILVRLIENLLFPGGSIQSDGSQVDTLTMPSGDNLTLLVGTEHQQSWVLSQHLKHPCTSRVQKIFNVQVALSALATAKDTGVLFEGLSAEDIVDGHREKTVGLLWSLVCRWGLASLVNFEMLEHERCRLDKVFARRSPRGSTSQEQMKADNVDMELPKSGGQLQKYADLLRSWARSVCRLHDVTISNLSTSFADGIALNSIIQEYAPHIPRATAAAAPHASFLLNNIKRETSSSSSSSSSPAVADTLQAIGCSKAFVTLFQTTSTIPTLETTVPSLAFLAARLLPAARPHIAATTIQRAWRLYAARRNLHRRVKLAALARDAAVVVGIRERIFRAAVVIQRAWRKHSGNAVVLG